MHRMKHCKKVRRAGSLEIKKNTPLLAHRGLLSVPYSLFPIPCFLFLVACALFQISSGLRDAGGGIKRFVKGSRWRAGA